MICKECGGLLAEFPIGDCTTPHVDTNPKAPREFWVSPGVEAWQSDEVVMNPACVKPHHIHVIEKSAFDQLEARSKQLRRALKDVLTSTGMTTKERNLYFRLLDETTGLSHE